MGGVPGSLVGKVDSSTPTRSFMSDIGIRDLLDEIGSHDG
jgi:hypothetical protein